MPYKLKLSILAIMATLILIGCARSNFISSTSDMGSVPNESSTCSVTYKSGITKNYNSLSLITGVLITPFLLADGHIKIKGSEITGYSTAKYEALSQDLFYTTVKSKIAKKVLPGFAIKTVSGAFNLYSLEFYNNGTITTKYFLQEGSEADIQLVDAALLTRHFATPSSNKLSKKNSRVVNGKTLITLVEEFNKSSSLSKTQN